ncbi:MAG: hypothetical protein ABSA77_09990 [Thermoguttaceae bacterium]|jgi:hypothetical protein
MPNKEIQAELLKRIHQMSEEEQRQVLKFASNLPASSKKAPAAHFLDLAGTLDHESAQDMLQSIEEDCEQIDANAW